MKKKSANENYGNENYGTGNYGTVELERLAGRGVVLPAPDKVVIGREVPLEVIAAGAVLHPFCRIAGAETRIGAGAVIGLAGPATLENARVSAGAIIGSLGPVTLREVTCGAGTVLGCGVAEHAVFLGREGAEPAFTTGYGFRVRAGSLYEEGANSAQHTDTKMTLLFPWVTLGSNINWCDTLMAGGSGPGLGQFSEVGSGAIHFNFTPRGDKATASLFGTVPEGVFLAQPRLFIGGNGSLIGPLQAAFGAITGAGGTHGRTLGTGLNLPALNLPGGAVHGRPLRDEAAAPFDLEIYGSVKRVFDSQVGFIAQLAALNAWYGQARALIARGDPGLSETFRAGGEIVRRNITERTAQLAALAARMERSAALLEQRRPGDARIAQHRALLEGWPGVEVRLRDSAAAETELPGKLRQGLEAAATTHGRVYTRIVQGLPVEAVASGKAWLWEITQRVASPEVLGAVPPLRSR